MIEVETLLQFQRVLPRKGLPYNFIRKRPPDYVAVFRGLFSCSEVKNNGVGVRSRPKGSRSGRADAIKSARWGYGAVWMPLPPSGGRGVPSSPSRSLERGGANRSPEDTGGLWPGVGWCDKRGLCALLPASRGVKKRPKKPIYASYPPLFKGWW